jgi:hypothetical protein
MQINKYKLISESPSEFSKLVFSLFLADHKLKDISIVVDEHTNHAFCSFKSDIPIEELKTLIEIRVYNSRFMLKTIAIENSCF